MLNINMMNQIVQLVSLKTKYVSPVSINRAYSALVEFNHTQGHKKLFSKGYELTMRLGTSLKW